MQNTIKIADYNGYFPKKLTNFIFPERYIMKYKFVVVLFVFAFANSSEAYSFKKMTFPIQVFLLHAIIEH